MKYYEYQADPHSGVFLTARLCRAPLCPVARLPSPIYVLCSPVSKSPHQVRLPQRLLFLTERVFPKENYKIYYTKPKGSLERAHGRLFDAVTNLKAKYRRNKVFEPRARRSLEKVLTQKPSTSSSSERSTAHFDDLVAADNNNENDQEIKEMIEWLKSNVDNYSSCAEKWDKTNKERLKRILSNENKSYLQEFPCIQRSWGYNLVCI